MPPENHLDSLHHVAISVADIATAVSWYTDRFRCEISYQDSSWAMLRFANCELALVIPEQHPPHLGFTNPHADRYGNLKEHRDGSRSVYISDPFGNTVEMVDADSVAGLDPNRDVV